MMHRYLIDPEEWSTLAADTVECVAGWTRPLTSDEERALFDLHLARGPGGYTVALMALDDAGADEQLILMRRRDYEYALGELETLAPGSAAVPGALSAYSNRDRHRGFLAVRFLTGQVHDAVVQAHTFGAIAH